MIISRILHSVRRRWVAATLVFLICVIAACAFALTRSPSYEATSKVFVGFRAANSATDLTAGNAAAAQLVDSYAELATTPLVLRRVSNEVPSKPSVASLQASVSAASSATTVLITISATERVSRDAVDIANSVAHQLSIAATEISPETSAADASLRLTEVQSATSASPSGASLQTIFAIGVLGGAILGILFAMALDTLDSRVRSVRELKSITQVPVLAEVMFDPAWSQSPLGFHLRAQEESYNTLAASTRYLGISKEHKVFLVTSSMEGEGKSTTAARLAVAMKLAGESVVLVECDMRRPSVASYLGLEAAVGLSDAIIGAAGVDDVVQHWGDMQLAVVPSGPVPPNPASLAQAPELASVISELSRRYSIVLLDTPPVLPVADAPVMARLADGVLVVCGLRKLRAAQLFRALETLDQFGAPVVGLVASLVPSRGPDSTRSAYGYGYGGEYGNPLTHPEAPQVSMTSGN